MRKLLLSLVALALTANVSAQSINDETPFTEKKVYLNAGLSGLDLNFNSSSKWNLDASVKVGCFLKDNFMLLGEIMLGLHEKSTNETGVGAGVRYSFASNGLYVGAGARYKHYNEKDDFVPNINAGYTFFVSRILTIEPELYYDMSTRNFKDYSRFGLRMGFGLYL